MQILIAAIGKLKSGPELALFEHYAARCQWKITVKEFETAKHVARKEKEAEFLLKACEGAEHCIALDEHGEQMASAVFAKHLRKVRDQGMRKIAFIIGGADGLHEHALARADLLLSFGRVTWPHLLVRGLLAEQLYRAHTILSGHPYHRD